MVITRTAVLTLLAVTVPSGYADSLPCLDDTCKAGGTNDTDIAFTSLLQVKIQESISSSGHSKCPCLEPSQLDTQGGYFPEKVYEKQVEGEWVKSLTDCDDPAKEWLFPSHLGIGTCASMTNLPPFCGTGAAESPKRWTDDWMCQQQFCHVDPNNCPAEWVLNGNLFPGLAFSYRTCAPSDASQVDLKRIEELTALLKNDHRAYHCVAPAVDERLQKDADEVQEKMDKDAASLLSQGSGDSGNQEAAGDESCPCLDPSQLDTQGGYLPEKVYEKQVQGKWYKTLSDCDDDAKEWLFPSHLGIGKCDSMDSFAPFCGTGGADSPKRWENEWMCKQKFCHVDAAKCPKAWVISGNLFPGLAFSYRTCTPKGAPADEVKRVTDITHLLQKDHRAYHCTSPAVDEKLQKDADTVR